MKRWVGFLGRLTIVYGVPGLMFILAYDNLNIDSGWVIIIAVVWIFVFHYITKNWEDWGKHS